MWSATIGNRAEGQQLPVFVRRELCRSVLYW